MDNPTMTAMPMTARPATPSFQFTFASSSVRSSRKVFFESTSGGGSLYFSVQLQFRVQGFKQPGGIQLEGGGVIFHRAADIDLRGKHVEIALFERADVVGADFCHLGDLLNREFFCLARSAELFGNS